LCFIQLNQESRFARMKSTLVANLVLVVLVICACADAQVSCYTCTQNNNWCTDPFNSANAPSNTIVTCPFCTKLTGSGNHIYISVFAGTMHFQFPEVGVLIHYLYSAALTLKRNVSCSELNKLIF
jgi:hypothetical protein